VCAYQAVAQKWWALLVVHAKYHSVYDSNGHGGYLLVPCNREKVCSPTVVTYIILYLVNLKITMLVWPCKSVWLPALFLSLVRFCQKMKFEFEIVIMISDFFFNFLMLHHWLASQEGI
jgi:hypothetical protein